MQRDSNGNIIPWTCPRCGKISADYPALSRTDNKTDICSQCGLDEAMSDWAKHIQSKQNDK